MTTINNNPTISVRTCEGCEGCEGSRRCVTHFNFNSDFSRNKHSFTNNTHIELPSQLSHSHIYAQNSVRVPLLPSHSSQQYSRSVNQFSEIESGLDFVLSHLEKPILFPRTIMTKKLGYQRLVYSKKRH